MNIFRSFLELEFKRFFGWRNVFISGLFLLLSISLVHMGVQQYKSVLVTRDKFQEIEKEKVKTFINYTQYGGYGIRLLFQPSPLNILFYNSSKFSDLTAHIDVGGKLNIYNSYKGEKAFSERQGKFLDFSGAILLLGSLLALFYGYEFLRHREYHKFITSLLGTAQSFICHIVSKIILISLYFITIAGCAVILLFIELENFSEINFQHISSFTIVMFLVFIFFFLLGAISGITGSKFARFFIILVWVGSVYFAPAVLNKIVKVKADKLTSNYQFELDKLNALMDFEKRAAVAYQKEKKKPGIKKDKLKNSIKKIMKSYLTEEFKNIQTLDDKAKQEMAPLIKNYQAISIFFPSTFYLSVSNEIGSSGYRNIIYFYEKIRETRKKFVEFYTDKRGEELARKIDRLPPPPVESFIKGDENIISGQSKLPVNFSWGIFVTITWILLLAITSYFLYRRALSALPKTKGKINGLKDVEININRREVHAIISRDKILNQHMFNLLSGMNKEFNGKVLLNDADITEKEEKIDFAYLCHPENIPWGIKARDFITFIGKSLKITKSRLKDLEGQDKLNLKKVGKKYFNELTASEKGRILFECALLKECSIYMIDDFTRGMPANFITIVSERLEELKQKGAVIIYLTDDVITAQKVGDVMTLLKKDAGLLGIKL